MTPADVSEAVDPVVIDEIEGVSALPDGFRMTLRLDGEPDELLRGVIEGWPLGSPGLRSLQVVRDRIAVVTELDVDAPARALAWLRDGPDPALAAMQRHADGLRDGARQALARAQAVLPAQG